jgi:outer membrane protein TolC
MPLAGQSLPAPIEEQIPELAEILDSARRRAPDLLRQDFLKEESERRLQQARSAYYPRLDIVSNLGYRDDFRTGAEDSRSFGMTYSANLSRPIYHWGAIEARVEQARIGNDTGTLNFNHNLRNIEQRIRSEYLQLVLSNMALENERGQRRILEADREQAAINYQAGKLSELDYSNFRLNLEASLLRIEQIEQSKRRIRDRFKLYTGAEVDLGKTISEIPLPDLGATKEWLTAQMDHIENSRNWLQGNYLSQIKQNQIRQQTEAITVVKSRQRPIIDAAASATQQETNTSTQNNVQTLSLFAGIRVTWNIFDGFRTRNEKLEATTALRRLKMELNELSEELQLQALERIDGLLFSIRDLQIHESTFANKLSQFSNVQADAESGRISQKQFENAELQIQRERLAVQQKRANFVLGLSDYKNFITPIRETSGHR